MEGLMQRIHIILIVLFVSTGLAFAQSESEAKTRGNPSKKVIDGVTYWLIVSQQPRELVKQFDNAAPGASLKVEGVTKVKRATEFGFALFLSGCQSNPVTGKCDVVATYRIFTPDGKLAVERPNLPVWSDAPPKKLDLSKALWVTSSDPTDPSGTNIVRAEITDRIAKRTIILDQSFELVP